MGFVRRFLDRATESDEERLRAEIREWAKDVPDVVPIGEAPLRQHVRVAGAVRRITVWPREGDEPEYMEITLDDGTGTVGVTWIGRRSVPGLSLGSRLLIEGVTREELRGGHRTIDNPRFEFVR